MGMLSAQPTNACTRDFAFLTAKEKFYNKNSRYLSQELIALAQLVRVPVVGYVKRLNLSTFFGRVL